MNKKIVRIAIIIAWCLLIACCAFKLFGSEVFNVAVESQRFIEVCNWLDGDGVWCKYILMFIMNLSATTFVILASALKYKVSWKWLIIIMVCASAIWGIKFANSIAAFVLECVQFIVLPALISKKWYYGIVGLVLNFVFQLFSMFIRGQEAIIFDDNTILSLVMTIDYYIMIALYYMYAILINKRKEDKQNG